MNYALDAIWWRLTKPEVRDLASILTAPALWHTGCELGVRDLLGERGFRYLIDLNDDIDFRLPENTAHHLLGKYAENLLAFWLANAPHCQLLARNVAIFNEENQSVGELDFVAKINGVVYHIELACKYYGSHDGQPENMVGLNDKDRLCNKLHKIHQQLQLSDSPFARKILAEYGVNADNLRRVSVVRGGGFTASGCLPRHKIYPENAWVGKWIHHLNDLHNNILDEEKWFYRLPKNGFLAPARISGSLKVSAADLVAENGLIAQVVQRPDGAYHEIQRFMLQQSIL